MDLGENKRRAKHHYPRYSQVRLPTGNIYEAVSIMSKRANQISLKLRKSFGKLQEFFYQPYR